jgi:ABC-type sugar transport system ATPase subunit
MAELAELAVGRTCVYVAHRLSTVKGCDRIVVLSEGTVVEQGSHEALLGKNGLYAQMWRRQIDEATREETEGVVMGRTPAPEEDEQEGGAALAAAAAAAVPAMLRAE